MNALQEQSLGDAYDKMRARRNMTAYVTVCSVFGQYLAPGARCSDDACPQHGGRNYDVGSTLVRWESDRGYCLLTVESIRESRYGFPTIIHVRHEDGHREMLQVKPGIPIERALFGYSVTSS